MLNKIFSMLFGVKSGEAKGTRERKVTESTPETQKANFQKLTAKEVARENGIEYISEATGKRFHTDRKFVNQVYAVKALISCYILQMMECLLVLLSGMVSSMEKAR